MGFDKDKSLWLTNGAVLGSTKNRIHPALEFPTSHPARVIIMHVVWSSGAITEGMLIC